LATTSNTVSEMSALRFQELWGGRHYAVMQDYFMLARFGEILIT
jgi:hypothetical protein